ncbi:MAG: PDZ domain-containing protein [Bacteroidales bacterium]|nr:PDZ domain-containing protein [Bacteroidales bacterium]
MKKKDLYTLTVALLGIVVGILLAMTVNSVRSARKIRVSDAGWQKLNLILQTVSNEYVDTIDYKTVTEAAISEALASLDPHSVYMPPVELEASETELAGNFEGIGIQFNVPNDTAIVLEVIPGGPAEKVGMLQGDRLLKVDQTTIAGVKFPQDSMVRRMKGPSGTKVLITVLREGEEIPFEITRGKIPVHSIDASFMIDDTTGYIRLSKFAKNTAKEFVTASEALLKHGMRHLIFDLRDNTGGYLDQALTLSKIFLDKGQTIVYTEGLHSPREDYKADGSGYMKKTRLSVLINEGSASSSEIFAGAMQDNDRGIIIGRRSFGKGLVQKPYMFSDGSGMRLTIARFHTPSGRCIQKPYSSDYQYDIYKRYEGGEMYDADSIKVNKDEEYLTLKGRKVYGGGGIVPDVFVPVDTTRVTDFYMKVRAKATAMRFASWYFDSHKAELASIDDFDALVRYLDGASLENSFRYFAASRDGIRPASEEEWTQTVPYLMTQVRALVGRYSKLGDQAFYHLYIDYDTVIEEALKWHAIE